MQRTASILAYLIICSNSFAQGVQFSSGQNFRHINVQNGLVHNVVYHFLEDSRGYMWLGTHNGITLHDGNKALNFLHNPNDKSSISGTFITSVLEDSAQQIWIGNESGIDRFDRSSLSFSHFGVDRGNGIKVNTYCVALGFVRSHELWFLDTEKKSVRSLNTSTGATKFIAPFNTNHALFYKDPSSQTIHLWSAYDKGTIHQVYNQEKLLKEETFFDGKNKSRIEPELTVLHVLHQNDSTVWFSTNKGLVRLNPLSNKYQLFNSWKGKNVRELRYAAIANDDLLWVGSGPDGIYSFDIRTNQFINNFKNDKFNSFSICSDNIVSLYHDKTGNLWCGSYGNGVSYTNTKNSFLATHISKEETAKLKGNNHISLLGTDLQGNVWCTFQNIIGIAFLDKNFKLLQYRTLQSENGSVFNNPIYKLLFETNDEAWLASSKGLFLYNLKTNRLRSIKYPLVNEEVQGSIWVKDLLRLQDGSILFSTFAGLYHITNTSGNPIIKIINVLQPGAYNGFGKLAQDKQGLIYVKSLADHIHILRASSNKDQFELVKSIDFMPEVNQFFNYDADSLLYIASDAGLYTINTNSLVFQKDTLNNRTPFMSINSFFREKERFWFFGEKGLYCYDKDNKESTNFTMEDGLPANDFSVSSFVIDKAGRCVAGTSNGLISFYPSDVQFIQNFPRPRFTALYINDRLDTLHANPDEIKSIKLKSYQNTFAFDFSSISFFHANENTFEYKLEGYDDNWIRSGITQYTRYSRISPGKYTFMVRALDNQGKVSSFSRQLEIEIEKSFWQTNFFKAVVVLVILIVGWFFLKWYANQKLRKQQIELERLHTIEKERTRIATDMHDDLGAGLSRIRYLSESIGLKKQMHQPFDEDISKISEYSHEMLNKMGEIVWALNEKNDTLSDLLAYTRAYSVEYLTQNGIACKVEAPEHFPTTFVSGEFRRNIYLTVKEALHNIVKHSQATSVVIRMSVNQQLQISIIDNGIGFDRTKIRSFSNGLTNMESRINSIRGKFKIENRAGTAIKILAPLSV